MKDIKDLLVHISSIYIGSEFKIDGWKVSDIEEYLNLSNKELGDLVNKTAKECQREGSEKAYDVNFIFDSNSEIKFITVVGMYVLVKHNKHSVKYSFLDSIFNELKERSIDELIRYQGYKNSNSVSETTKNKNSNYSWEMKGEYESKLYDKSLKIPNLDIDDKSHVFYDKRIVITGGFDHFDNRREMAQLIKDVGGDNNTAISKKTDFVIVGENPGPSKMKKIAALEIKTFSELEFIDLFEKQLLDEKRN